MIMTDEENSVALCSELDDASLGKLVKKRISLISSHAEHLDEATICAAAILLCRAATEHNASEITLKIDGLTQKCLGFVNWKVVVMQTATA